MESLLQLVKTAKPSAEKDSSAKLGVEDGSSSSLLEAAVVPSSEEVVHCGSAVYKTTSWFTTSADLKESINCRALCQAVLNR